MQEAGGNIQKTGEKLLTKESIQGKLDPVKSDIISVRREKNGKITERQEHTTSLQAERKKYTNNRELFKKEDDQRKDLDSKIQGKKSDIDGVEKQIQELQKNIVTPEDQEKLNALVQKKTRLEGELKSLEATLAIVQKKIANLDKEEKEISAEITRLDSALGIIEGDITALEEREERLTNEDTKLTTQLDDLSEIINDGQKKSQELLALQKENAQQERAEREEATSFLNRFNGDVGVWPLSMM